MRLWRSRPASACSARGAAGCSTTQEKAAAQKVESEKFLKERAERQAAKKKAKAKAKHHKHDKQKGKK